MMYNLPWAQSDVMDELTKGVRKPVAMNAAMKILERGMSHVEPGRNEACLGKHETNIGCRIAIAYVLNGIC